MSSKKKFCFYMKKGDKKQVIDELLKVPKKESKINAPSINTMQAKVLILFLQFILLILNLNMKKMMMKLELIFWTTGIFKNIRTIFFSVLELQS